MSYSSHKPLLSRLGLFSLLLVLLTLFAACGGEATASNQDNSGKPKLSLKELRLGLIPSENATKMLQDTTPFAKELEKQLGVPVKLSVAPNYTATITAMSAGQLDVAWFGPFSYTLAADKYNAEAFVQQLQPNGDDHYYSYIVTTKKTGIKTIADLKGHSFTYVDPASTSGNLVPRYTMKKNGLDPDKDVKGTFAGGHDASLLAVLGGKADAGAVASDVYAKLLKAGKFTEDEVVIVAKSDPIPGSPVAYRKELSQSDKQLIQQAFLNVKDTKALDAIATKGFTTATDSKFDLLRSIAKELHLDVSKLK
ncbi:phosphonate transport system substrate-binding protein [Thermosporothrix hazakensis]|jgi:phosphonate transport system substrate-binding protein|uniref:Phosphonate transport system substrate-binding protein n=1 Tax=Thermosporothrix hazakensis TaxID=644383 RepID=A0A326UR61_THEHA|nr:phosphate/phosphite/phosphonate ABC transporter substrate-binding protein [Thermosporothrix hazakensis]PZW32937.1 phosphonate transport system substrate-binding protein [Thermosporothrix hazakensis]GCE48969.1 phosphonates-binding protein [Thermosporothrix hazakensis]